MPIIINEDSVFLVAAEGGDVRPGGDMGLYFQDTRFLSRYELRMAGATPTLLASHNLEYYRAVHIMANPAYDGIAEGSLSITRTQTVGEGFHEDIDIINFTDAPVELPVEIFFGVDFADILEVRGQLVVGQEIKDRLRGRYWASIGEDDRSFTLHYADARFAPSTYIRFSRPLQIPREGNRAVAKARIAPRETWHL